MVLILATTVLTLCDVFLPISPSQLKHYWLLYKKFDKMLQC